MNERNNELFGDCDFKEMRYTNERRYFTFWRDRGRRWE